MHEDDGKYFYTLLSESDKYLIPGVVGTIVKQAMETNKYDHIEKLLKDNKLDTPKENINLVIKELQKTHIQKMSGPQVMGVMQEIIRVSYQHKPCFQRTMFFPNRTNEKRLAAVLNKAKHTVDLAVFAFTNDAFRDALLECQKRGVKIRVIGDDECAKFMGADIYHLCLAGI